MCVYVVVYTMYVYAGDWSNNYRNVNEHDNIMLLVCNFHVNF